MIKNGYTVFPKTRKNELCQLLWLLISVILQHCIDCFRSGPLEDKVGTDRSLSGLSRPGGASWLPFVTLPKRQIAIILLYILYDGIRHYARAVQCVSVQYTVVLTNATGKNPIDRIRFRHRDRMLPLHKLVANVEPVVFSSS